MLSRKQEKIERSGQKIGFTWLRSQITSVRRDKLSKSPPKIYKTRPLLSHDNIYSEQFSCRRTLPLNYIQ